MDNVVQFLTCSACIGDNWLVQLDLAGPVFYTIRSLGASTICSQGMLPTFLYEGSMSIFKVRDFAKN